MGRPNKYWQERLAREREKALQDIFELQAEAYQHIKDSLRAAYICRNCDSTFKAAKVNAEGRCLSCDGTGIIPDTERREWAVEQIISRTLPKPKQTELTVSDTAPETVPGIENMTDADLAKFGQILEEAKRKDGNQNKDL